MPITRHDLFTAGAVHHNPFVGRIEHPWPVRVVPANLNAEVVDAYGYLKPGMIFRRDGTLIPPPPAAAVAGFGLVIEAIKVAEGNTAPQLAAAPPIDVTLGTICMANRALIEDNLGRVLNANELAAFGGPAGGSPVVLGY